MLISKIRGEIAIGVPAHDAGQERRGEPNGWRVAFASQLGWCSALFVVVQACSSTTSDERHDADVGVDVVNEANSPVEADSPSKDEAATDVMASSDAGDVGSEGSDADSVDADMRDAEVDAAIDELELPRKRDAGRDGGDARADSDGPTDAARTCKPCDTHAWACWPMPNAPASGLPNPAMYTDLNDGTVRDNVTCLVWERDVSRTSPPPSDWAAQRGRCASLSLAGGGWRLPTRIEALSIADPSRTLPAIDSEVFISAPPQYFWTSSLAGANSDAGAKSWIVDFAWSRLATSAQSSHHVARCVRGNGLSESTAPPPNHYTLLPSGEVQDNFTGLVWQQGDSYISSMPPMTWTDAVKYCESHDSGTRGWRLPSIKELATLVDDAGAVARSSPAVDRSVFGGTSASDPYWASTVFADDVGKESSGRHWSIEFQEGATSYQELLGHAKCVR